ncbi:MAG: DNA/RNA non-specific endonuclease [Acidobacteriota bacterium]|nr:DNA/RNA non-specific endonuclease [Acidobacteriota bacterium]
MKNKAIVGGVIALVVLVLIVFLCIWLGRKINDKIQQTPETTTNTTVPPSAPSQPPATNEQAAQVFLALGNPSGATASASNKDNYLMVNTAYALSYNNAKGTPNWVAWRVAESDFGSADRQNNFRPDDRLPPGFKRVTPTDYTGSGFDRGHLCPSADRSSSPDANSLTFLMTNMTPQTPDLNRNVWEHFESYARELVKRDKLDIYIVAGVYGEKGKLKGKVTVPTNCWKIIVGIPQGESISGISEKARLVAVDMPNDTGIATEDWRKFRTTVRSIEQKTGYNFFTNLPQNVRDALEMKMENY